MSVFHVVSLFWKFLFGSQEGALLNSSLTFLNLSRKSDRLMGSTSEKSRLDFLVGLVDVLSGRSVRSKRLRRRKLGPYSDESGPGSLDSEEARLLFPAVTLATGWL